MFRFDDAHPPQAQYMPALDGVRAVACLLVVWSHINSLVQLFHRDLSGTLGVTLFFCLSGFLMGALYVHKSFDRDHAIRFVIARLSRIAPAYYVALTFAAVAGYFMADHYYLMDGSMLAKSYLFAGSTGVFWSIPPEVQFYLFFLIVWMAFQRALHGRYALIVLVGMISLGFILTRDFWHGILLPSKYHIFLAGFLGSVLLGFPTLRRWCAQPVFQLISLALLIAYTIFFARPDDYGDLILPLIMTLVIMAMSHSTRVTAPFETKFLRLLGHASFSIYLLHDVLLHLYKNQLLTLHWPKPVLIAVVFVVSITVPLVFYLAVERRLHEGSRAKLLEWYDGLKRRWVSA